MKDKEKIIIALPGQILDYVDTKENLVKLYNYINGLEKRVDEAIKYVKENTEYLDIEKGEVFECEGYRSNRVPIISTSGLLNILKGEDNGNN